MEIFIIKEGRVYPTAEALLIPVFGRIWTRDDSTGKEQALFEIAFIEFMCSYKKSNLYIGYTDEVERAEKILAAFFFSSNDNTYNDPREDMDVKVAMDYYKEVQHDASPSIRFYEAALQGATQMVDFFTNVDLNARNSRTGALLYKPADLTRALKDTNDILKTLTSMKENVYKELAESAKGKGDREINYFEKPPEKKK